MAKKRSSSSRKSVVTLPHKERIQLDPGKMVNMEGYKKSYHYFEMAWTFFLLGSLIWWESANRDENKNKKFKDWPTFTAIILSYIFSLLALIFMILPSSIHPRSFNLIIVVVSLIWAIVLFTIWIRKKRKQ